MKFCVLASGSKGNMTYVEENDTRLLIDAGISLSNAQKRTDKIDFKNITHILITHEHSDHVGFLDSIAKKTNAKIYISKKSFFAMKIEQREKMIGKTVYFIEGEAKYTIGSFEVLTLSLTHDTQDILGFVIRSAQTRLAYITDTGVFPYKYTSILKDVNALIIEANHDVKMLQESQRDIRLKHRILSAKGHLSNTACYEVLERLVTNHYKYVVLAHISEECNCIDAIQKDVIDKIEAIYSGSIIVAKQDVATNMMVI